MEQKVFVKGYEPVSFSEWPGKIVSIIFTPRCNFKCPFCHNATLVLSPENLENIDSDEILEELESRKNWIDAVEVTGGEPTVFPEIMPLLEKIKEKGFLIKFDTNGTNPEILKKILEKKLADYVAMDIKNSPEKYNETAGAVVDLEKINQSIKLIMQHAPDYEFRTTVLPKHHTKNDIEKIAKWIKGAKRFFIQNFRPANTLNPDYLTENSFSEKDLSSFKKIAETCIIHVECR